MDLAPGAGSNKASAGDASGSIAPSSCEQVDGLSFMFNIVTTTNYQRIATTFSNLHRPDLFRPA